MSPRAKAEALLVGCQFGAKCTIDDHQIARALITALAQLDVAIRCDIRTVEALEAERDRLAGALLPLIDALLLVGHMEHDRPCYQTSGQVLIHRDQMEEIYNAIIDARGALAAVAPEAGA